MTTQNTLGDDFATNRNLGMELGSGRANKASLADEEQLQAAQERRRLLAAGQQDIFGDAARGDSATPPTPDTPAVTAYPPIVEKAAPPPVAHLAGSRILRPRPGQLPNYGDVPIGALATRLDLFQHRDVPRGQSVIPERVDDIVRNWDPDRFEAIGVVEDPANPGRYIVIAGHHRLEAVRQKGFNTIPVRVLSGDIANPVDLERMKEQARISNYGVAPTGLREDINTVMARERYLQQQGEAADSLTRKLAGDLRKSSSEIERLRNLSTLPEKVMDVVAYAPQYAAVASELGNAVRKYGWTAEAVQQKFDQLRREEEESGRLVAAGILKQQIIDLEKLKQYVPPTEFAGFAGMQADVTIDVARQHEKRVEELLKERNKLERDLKACRALGEKFQGENGESAAEIEASAKARIRMIDWERENSTVAMINELRGRAGQELLPAPERPKAPRERPQRPAQPPPAPAPPKRRQREKPQPSQESLEALRSLATGGGQARLPWDAPSDKVKVGKAKKGKKSGNRSMPKPKVAYRKS